MEVATGTWNGMDTHAIDIGKLPQFLKPPAEDNVKIELCRSINTEIEKELVTEYNISTENKFILQPVTIDKETYKIKIVLNDDASIDIKAIENPTKLMYTVHKTQDDIKKLTKLSGMELDSQQFFNIVKSGFGDRENVKIISSMVQNVIPPYRKFSNDKAKTYTNKIKLEVVWTFENLGITKTFDIVLDEIVDHSDIRTNTMLRQLDKTCYNLWNEIEVISDDIEDADRKIGTLENQVKSLDCVNNLTSQNIFTIFEDLSKIKIQINLLKDENVGQVKIGELDRDINNVWQVIRNVDNQFSEDKKMLIQKMKNKVGKLEKQTNNKIEKIEENIEVSLEIVGNLSIQLKSIIEKNNNDQKQYTVLLEKKLAQALTRIDELEKSNKADNAKLNLVTQKCIENSDTIAILENNLNRVMSLFEKKSDHVIVMSDGYAKNFRGMYE